MKKNNNKKILITTLLGVILIAVLAFVFSPNLFKDKKKDSKEKKQSQEVVKKKITPLIYKVTKDGSDTVIYLFGSVHVADVNNYEFPEYFDNAFDSSDYVTCEFDSTVETNQTEEMLKGIYLDGTSLKDHVSSETYEKLKTFLEDKGEKIEDVENYKLLFVTSIFQSFYADELGLDLAVGVDDFIINKAKKAGKKILEVESQEFQDEFLNSVPDRVYEIALLESVDNFDDEIESTRKMLKAWEIGDEEGLHDDDSISMDETKYSTEDIQLINDFNKQLIDDRNITMTEKFEEYFNDNKNTFFMVGAGHIVGPNGIANLLQKKGYTVEKLK